MLVRWYRTIAALDDIEIGTFKVTLTDIVERDHYMIHKLENLVSMALCVFVIVVIQLGRLLSGEKNTSEVSIEVLD